jgi:hypothetical protein
MTLQKGGKGGLNMALTVFDSENLKKTAQVAGLFYLGLIVFGIIGQVARSSLIVPDNAAETASNILASEMQFRVANVVWLFSEMFLLLLALALYVVLKPVNKNLASLMVVFAVVGVAIESINTLNQFAALQLLSGADLTVFTADQVNAQAMSYIDSWETGYSIAAIMSFGPWLIPAGYLVYTSGYFPRVLGILVMLAGFGIAFEGLQHLLSLDNEVIGYLFAAMSVIGEFSFCGWLMVKGAKMPAKGADE